jgi:hypothetical protein
MQTSIYNCFHASKLFPNKTNAKFESLSKTKRSVIMQNKTSNFYSCFKNKLKLTNLKKNTSHFISQINEK